MIVEVAKTDEIAPGGMKVYEVEGREIVLCNSEGVFYAVDRRCGHMNAPLEMGTLTGYILTCPMHCAQFDITTGEALSGPVPHDFGPALPEALAPFFQRIGRLMTGIKTCKVRTYQVEVEGGTIKISL